MIKFPRQISFVYSSVGYPCNQLKILLLFFCFSLAACQQKLELTIPQEKFILIMADMHMAEASMQRMTSKMKDTLAIRYYNEIYEIHEINQDLYLENLKILEQNPKLAKTVFDSVLEKIGEEENREIQNQKDMVPEEGSKPEAEGK